MPQITSIEPQRKNKNRLNIFLDGTYAFSLESEALLKNGLKINKQLTQKQIDSIVREKEIAKLMDLALNYLSYRQRSRKEIEEYLAKKIAQKENIKFKEARKSELIEVCLKKLTTYKYIDDFEFAKWWVESRTRSNPKGKRVIRLELLRKGVDPDIVDKVLEKNLNQKELAQKAIQKKLRTWRNLSDIELKIKAYRYLLSRGFEYDQISETVAQLVKKR